MTVSLYPIAIPPLVLRLNVLSAMLDKAAAYAEAKKFDPSVLLNARLAPDMHPLCRQVQIATDMDKGCAARLGEVEVPSYPDTETTIPELKERIAKTIAFMQSVDPAKVDASADRVIELKFGPNDFSQPGASYVANFALPNIYFHLTTAYAILRHNGLEVGKFDFMGRPPEA